MSGNAQEIELIKSQSKFAANLDPELSRKSEYLKTNFQTIRKFREVKLEDPDYDSSVGNGHMNLDDYYTGLRPNHERLSLDTQMLIKNSFKSNLISFLFHCLLLLVAVVCASSVGVFYYYIQPQTQLLKASWRLLFLGICISPLAIIEYFRGRDRFIYSREVLWNGETCKKIILASIGHAIWTIALVIAVNHTSMAQANLLINLHPMIILMCKMINKSNVIKIEIIGAITVIVGIVLIIYDDSIGSADGLLDLNQIDSWTRNTFGNVIAGLGSLGGTIYFTRNHQLKDQYPFFLRILVISLLGFIYISLFAIVTEGANISLDSQIGIFGLFTQEWIIIYLINIAVTGFGAYIGYVVSLQYFQPLLLSIVPHMEPIFATLLCFLLGWQAFPGLLTIIAFILIIPGTICIIIGNREVEVRQYDIRDDPNLPLISFYSSDQKVPKRISNVRHYRTSSVVAPITWEK